VAERLGTTQSAVSKWERAERRIDIVELRQFCRAVGITLGEFVAAMESAIEAEQ